MLENNNYIELGGELIFINSTLVANKNAEVDLGCKKGTKVVVKFIEGGIQPRIGVVANIRIKSWGNLDGGLSNSTYGGISPIDCGHSI